MCRRDRGHDRKPETQAAGCLAGPTAVHALEGQEEPAELVGRDVRAGVGDRDERAVSPHAGGDLQLAAGDVVPDRVIDEVGDKASGQVGVTERGGRVKVRDDVQVWSCLAGYQCLLRDLAEVERIEPVEAALAARQREHRGDQPFVLLVGG
jgi:hypothetical protein